MAFMSCTLAFCLVPILTHIPSGFLSGIYSGLLSGSYSDIHSGILIYSDIFFLAFNLCKGEMIMKVKEEGRRKEEAEEARRKKIERKEY